MIIPTGIGTRLLRKPWLTYALVLLNVGVFFLSKERVEDTATQSKEIFKATVKADIPWFETYLIQDCRNRSPLSAESCTALTDYLIKTYVGSQKADPVSLASIRSIPAMLYLQLKVPKALQVSLFEYSRLKGREGYQMNEQITALHKKNGMFSVVNQNWWAALSSLFFHLDWMHLLGNMFMLLIFGSLLEQKVSRSFFLAVYITGGFVGLLPMVTISKASLSFFVGNSGCVAALMGAAWIAYRKFNIRCLFLPLFPMPFLARSFMVPVAWALPCLYFAADVVGFLSNQTGVAFDAHLIGVGVGALAIFYDSQSAHFQWPWISSEELRLFEDSRALPLEERLVLLRRLALSNFSNHKSWIEWARVAIKYRHEASLKEISSHLHAQVIAHSSQASGCRGWVQMFSRLKDEKGFELLFSMLIPVEVLGIAEKALEHDDSTLGFKLLTLPCLKKDLHWIVNAWVRRLKRNKMSPRFKELAAKELDLLCNLQELPTPLKKFHELLNKERAVNEPLAA